ncbi:NADH:ubiquinone reductase (Na(+)-transporting) subunit B [Desulfosediminicola sp.]|uniref:NADH:ubiquinone reductase (Na(+)-transporting) subunit B n=1 Tax=Desulfosediminicola sp. TaxID=2886825 RepID=UPI003AF230F5
MNKLSKKMEELGQHFEPGARFARWYPLYEAFDSFLFGSNTTTRNAPHVRDGIDLKRIMTTVLIALFPCVIMALWNTGYQANQAIASLGLAAPEGWRGAIMAGIGCDPASTFSNLAHGALYFLPIYVVTMVVGSIVEGIFNIIRGHEFSEAFLVTGLLYTLILPPTIPLWQVATGITFGLVFAKEVFGGVGRNFMNPALASRAFIYFAYPAQISGDAVWTAVDGVTGATPLGAAAAAAPGTPASAMGIDWLQMFIGNIPGSMGETSAIACLFGAVILLVTRVASWRIIVSMLIGGIIASVLLSFHNSPANALYSLPPYYHLVMGSFAFGMVFMATDPVSAAHTNTGQWLYGGLVGILCILIRVANPAYPEGTMLAIILGNVFAPLFDYFVLQANIKRRRLRHG